MVFIGQAFIGCACRKSNPGILMMQAAKHRRAKNVPGPLNAGCKDS
jgi:hypothetical protein